MFTACGKAKWHSHLGMILAIFYKANIIQPYDPAVMLLGIHPNELKTHMHTETCPQMILTAFSLIAKNWNALE